MFESIKVKKRQKELELIKESIIKEKEELEAIKEILEDKSKKIDISNTFIFTYGSLSYLVNLETIDSVHYNLRDIFNNQIIFNIISRGGNERQIYMRSNQNFNGQDEYADIYPILEDNPEFLIYVDRQVPEFLLQQYLYKLNNLDVRNYVKSRLN